MFEEDRNSWIFFVAIVLVYIIFYFFSPMLWLKSVMVFWDTIVKIIPIFIFVYLIMLLTNYYVTPKVAVKYLSRSSGLKRWLVSVIGGIISTGPIYMWYPMLKDLKERGVSYGFIAAFLYARAIKPALIPLMIFYFGLKLTIIVTVVMIIFSILQGIFVELLVKDEVMKR